MKNILSRSLRVVLSSFLAAPVSAQAVLEAPPITVTAKPRAVSTLAAPQAVKVLEGRELDRQRGQTVLQAAEGAGVSVLTTGAGVAKPVVRGLTSQRVLVVTDGVRQEGHSWGDEHGPEVDSLGVERLEILRGPHSLLYGPEALGGVIHVIHEAPPAEGPALAGRLVSDGFSNNSQGAGALSLKGYAGGGFGWSAYGSGRHSGDIRTPRGRLSNSGASETGRGAAAGLKKDWGALVLDYRGLDQRIEFHEDPAATTYQRVAHDKARLKASVPVGPLTLEAQTAWQRNVRREFEAAADAEPKLRLVLDTYTADLRAHHEPLGPLSGTFGVSAMQQRNDTQGEEKLVPGYRVTDAGVFLFEEAELGPVTLSGGVRYDRRGMFVKEQGGLGVAAQTRRYDRATGSAGGVWRFAEGWALAANVGQGWRAPSPFELFVNGEHEGSGRFEIGDAGLVLEKSLNADVSLRRAGERVQAELTAFRNRVSDFVFSSPTGGTDADSGLPIFRIRQADATLVGLEASGRLKALDWLELEGAADMVRARNDATGKPLPFIPANRLKLGATATGRGTGALRRPYVSVAQRLIQRQNRVEDREQPTAGYALLEFGLGAEVVAFGSTASVDLSLQNALNAAYRDHLSRYKAYALNPGRSFNVKVSVPFGG